VTTVVTRALIFAGKNIKKRRYSVIYWKIRRRERDFLNINPPILPTTEPAEISPFYTTKSDRPVKHLSTI
jgi:hypothetical protein